MAADISPIDVLSHIPLQCENKDIPYAFVRSRMELGIAAETKKPTSVILLIEPDDKKYKKKFLAIAEKV
jgi:H/ACA ribonucleoprotein complex subunit 2